MKRLTNRFKNTSNIHSLIISNIHFFLAEYTKSGCERMLFIVLLNRSLIFPLTISMKFETHGSLHNIK